MLGSILGYNLALSLPALSITPPPLSQDKLRLSRNDSKVKGVEKPTTDEDNEEGTLEQERIEAKFVAWIFLLHTQTVKINNYF